MYIELNNEKLISEHKQALFIARERLNKAIEQYFKEQSEWIAQCESEAVGGAK